MSGNSSNSDNPRMVINCKKINPFRMMSGNSSNSDNPRMVSKLKKV